MAGPNWNPRPIADGTEFNNKAYLCGYTDGYYGEAFGAHDRGRYGAFSAYRTGYGHGRSDTAGQVSA